MNKELNIRVITGWLDALRSDTYSQGFGGTCYQLNNDESNKFYHCSLGVLFETLDEFTRYRNFSLDDRKYYFYESSKPSPYKNDYAYNTYFEKEYGITRKLINNVVMWNDRKRLSFSEIADKIEDFCKQEG